MKKSYFTLFLKGRAALLAAAFLLAALPVIAGDLSLEQAVQLALERNEKALAAEEQIHAAAGRLSRARAYFFPAVSLNGTYTRRPYEVERDLNGQSITIQSLNAISGYASLNWILFDPAVIPSYRQAQFAQRGQRYSSADVRRRLSFEVAAAYLTTLTMDQVLEAAGRRLEYAGKTLDAARARYRRGLVSVNDVTRAELEYATAEMGSAQAKGEVQTAYLQLGFLLDTVIDGQINLPRTAAGPGRVAGGRC